MLLRQFHGRKATWVTTSLPSSALHGGEPHEVIDRLSNRAGVMRQSRAHHRPIADIIGALVG